MANLRGQIFKSRVEYLQDAAIRKDLMAGRSAIVEAVRKR